MTTVPRSLLLTATAAALSFAVPGSATADLNATTTADPSFVNPLRIPELLEGERGDDGVVRFQLDVQAGTTQFREGRATETWGVNGTYLGPTLRASRGDAVEVSVHNGIEETTTMHWHGMLLSARMDGGPYQPIDPGGTWRASWTIDQPAATLWYHPHPHGNTAEHVFRGVSGMFILEDDTTAELDLPHDYGVDDLPLIIQDRSFNRDNQFVGDGKQVGDELLVNGTLDAYVDVTHERVRMRVLNASGALYHDLGFADGRSFDVVGTDGGLLPAPVTVDRMLLSPGERAEIVVAFEPGEEAVLRNFAPGSSYHDAVDVLQLRAAPQLVQSPPVPARLSDIERLDAADAVATRTFRLSATRINGQNMAMDRIDATVAANTVEIWEVIAEAGEHNFHIHGVQFQVLDIDGAPPPPPLRGWKDTVIIPTGSTVRLIVPFGSNADPDVPYMYHCHRLRHEDLGMMGQFVVVAEGDGDGDLVEAHDHEHR